MRDLGAVIREKQRAIAALQDDLAALGRALTLVNPNGVKPHPQQGKLNPKSSVGRAVTVLRGKKEPMHVNDLLARLRGVKKMTLVSSLQKMAKKGNTFVKTGPATFGLLEWRR